MAMEYVPIFFDWVEVTGELNDQEKGRLIDAIVLYAQGGEWQERIKGNEKYLFPAFRRQIDRASEISRVRAQAGRTGAEQREANRSKCMQTDANAGKEKQTHANGYKTCKEEEKEKENEEEYKNKARESNRAQGPTLDEVRGFCEMTGSKIDPIRFWNYYEARHWMAGHSAITDWKACLRSWERDEKARDKAKTKTVSAQQYTQREYTNEELLAINDDLIEEAREKYG